MPHMASKVADIVKQASELDSSDRSKVVTQLLRTLDPPGGDIVDFETAWSDELERREREIENGEVELVDWDQLRASLQR